MPRQPRPAAPPTEPKPAPKPRAPRRRSAKAKEPPPQIHALAPEEAFAPLITERLILRPLLPHDAESLHRLINDWEVTRNLAVVPFPYPRPLADDWIASTARDLAAGAAYNLAITGRDGDHEIVARRGRAAARRSSLASPRWATGSAAASGGTAWPPRPPAAWCAGASPISASTASVADVATDNPASAAVLRRIGFRQTGEGVKHSVARGAEGPVWHFEATRDDVFGIPGADSSRARHQADAAGRRLRADR